MSVLYRGSWAPAPRASFAAHNPFKFVQPASSSPNVQEIVRQRKMARKESVVVIGEEVTRRPTGELVVKSIFESDRSALEYALSLGGLIGPLSLDEEHDHHDQDGRDHEHNDSSSPSSSSSSAEPLHHQPHPHHRRHHATGVIDSSPPHDVMHRAASDKALSAAALTAATLLGSSASSSEIRRSASTSSSPSISRTGSGVLRTASSGSEQHRQQRHQLAHSISSSSIIEHPLTDDNNTDGYLSSEYPLATSQPIFIPIGDMREAEVLTEEHISDDDDDELGDPLDFDSQLESSSIGAEELEWDEQELNASYAAVLQQLNYNPRDSLASCSFGVMSYASHVTPSASEPSLASSSAPSIATSCASSSLSSVSSSSSSSAARAAAMANREASLRSLGTHCQLENLVTPNQARFAVLARKYWKSRGGIACCSVAEAEEVYLNSLTSSSSAGKPVDPLAETLLAQALDPAQQQRLQRKLRRAVFGIPIPLLLARQKQIPALSSLDVPFVVYHIVEHIKATGGMVAEGIFRVSGHHGHQAEAVDQLDCGRLVNYEGMNVHTVAAILKYFLRRLPAPIVPRQVFFPRFRAAIGIASEEIRKHYMATIVACLPRWSFALLRYLTFFLNTVASFSSKNRMNASNLGMVFAPSWFGTIEDDIRTPSSNSPVVGRSASISQGPGTRGPVIDQTAMLQDALLTGKLATELITHCHYIFQDGIQPLGVYLVPPGTNVSTLPNLIISTTTQERILADLTRLRGDTTDEEEDDDDEETSGSESTATATSVTQEKRTSTPPSISPPRPSQAAQLRAASGLVFTSSEDLFRLTRGSSNSAKSPLRAIAAAATAAPIAVPVPNSSNSSANMHGRSRSLSLSASLAPPPSFALTKTTNIVQNGVVTSLPIPLSLPLLSLSVGDEIYVFMRAVRHGICYAEIDGVTGYFPLSILGQLRRLDVRAPAEVLTQLPMPSAGGAGAGGGGGRALAAPSPSDTLDIRPPVSPQILRHRSIEPVASTSF